ncbi:tripartite tricarboxylate transporter substrate-binding protein [Cupriavidus taiwanensis]|uniref:tripartite tricarboxylate transporter substrate-binding protein n=1 Tax=Cupriavidus taiwanensis TaxID=164546 RepID=UPI0020C5BFB0|nr:tripartite tricarboxylate transporter substrate-binding protein [Cupriavidus taiwanensis]
MAEAGVAGYEADVWFGVVGPRGLPPEVASRLSQEITRIAQDKAMRDKLGAADFDAGAVLGADPARYGQVGEAGAGIGGQY